MIELILWLTAALLLWILGGVSSIRAPGRSSLWPLLGNIGFGLCCVFFGMMTLDPTPLGDPFWTRLLWSTLLLTVPAWVAFSHRFARPEGCDPGQLQRSLLSLLWIGAMILLVLGSIEDPLISVRSPYGETLLSLEPPFGEWIVLHVMIGVMLLLWNLQATLEAARRTGRRRTSRAIYALLPLVMTGLYVMAELLLYRQQRETSGLLLLGAILVSGPTFCVIIARGKRGDLELPIGYPISYSSVVLTALGSFFVGLALLAEAFGRLGLTTESGWPERGIVGILAVLLSFWIFPGMREEVRRFLDRRLLVASSSDSSAWLQLAGIARLADTAEDLLVALRLLFLDRIGDLRINLWTFESLAGEYAPVSHPELPRLGPSHPLVRVLVSRSQPLLLAGGAQRIEEVPLHVACEKISHEHHLCVFAPIRWGGDLVAILGAGPGGTRTIFPEDIDRLGRVADDLGEPVAVLLRVASVRQSTDPSQLETVAAHEWLSELASSVGEEEIGVSAPSAVSYEGPEEIRIDRGTLEPLFMAMLRDGRTGSAGERSALVVRVVADQRLVVALEDRRWQMTLRLRWAESVSEAGETDVEGRQARNL